jgi:hypothetical protein
MLIVVHLRRMGFCGVSRFGYEYYAQLLQLLASERDMDTCATSLLLALVWCSDVVLLLVVHSARGRNEKEGSCLPYNKGSR